MPPARPLCCVPPAHCYPTHPHPVLGTRCLVWLTILSCLLIMIAITLIGYFKAGILTQDQIGSVVRGWLRRCQRGG